MSQTFVRAGIGVAMALALSAGPAMAKATYCMDPTTHKRISCTTAPPSTKAARAAVPAGPVPAGPTANAATGPHKGKKCGKSYIAADKTCHKTGG
jgi:hypothetical protein